MSKGYDARRKNERLARELLARLTNGRVAVGLGDLVQPIVQTVRRHIGVDVGTRLILAARA